MRKENQDRQMEGIVDGWLMICDVRVIGQQREEEVLGAWLRQSRVSGMAVAPGPSAWFFALRWMGGWLDGGRGRRRNRGGS